MTDATGILTPTARQAFGRWLFWISAVVFTLLIAVVVLFTVGTGGSGRPLDPTSPAPGGAMALAEVLRQQGVEVTVSDSLEDTRSSVGPAGTTTLVLHDLDLILDDAQLRMAVSLSDYVVLIDPVFSELQAVAPEVAQAGRVDQTLTADCELPAARTAHTVSGESSGYRIIDETTGAMGCFGSGDGVYSVIALPSGLTVLGTTGALSNEVIIQEANAAFALNLLGTREKLVWYLPSFRDLRESAPTMAELTPPWVIPALWLLAVTFIAAAVWRGRRFGPLVVENLPVTGRANETMLGRARLYQKSASRLRALDALRVGALRRLTSTCGLPRAASVDEVVAAVARLTGGQSSGIRHLLVEAVPANDAELVSYSDALLDLERDVELATRP